jgi:uncharacterized protein YjbJ (UPF0337 family)
LRLGAGPFVKTTFASGPANKLLFPGRETKARSLIRQFLTTRRKPMSTSTTNEIKGTFHEVKGKVKETAGQVTNNPDLEAEGKAEHRAGKVEKKVGQIKKVFEK